MRFGLTLGIGRRERLSDVKRIAATAESVGIDQLWFVDVQLSMKDPFAGMLLAAQSTRELWVGPGVSNPITRHPSVLANSLLAIHEVSGGRVRAGLGAGHTALYPIGEKPMRVKEFRDAALRVRGLLRGQEVHEDGRSYRLQVDSGEAQAPPLFLSATHPRMLGVAGEVGDGAILLGAADPAFVEFQVARVREGARSAKRDLQIDLWVGLSVGDNGEAIDAVRAFAAAQCRVLNRWKGAIPGDLEAYRDEMVLADTEYNLADHLKVRGSNVGLVSRELASQIAIAGSAESCRERIAELQTLGIDRMTFTLLSGDRLGQIEALGASIIGPLRRDVESG